MSVKDISVLHNGMQFKEQSSDWCFSVCQQHRRMSWAWIFHGTFKSVSWQHCTWVSEAMLVKQGAMLSGADFITPNSGSSLVTARPGHCCSPLGQGPGLLRDHFSREEPLFLPWLVVWVLQMKGFGKHSSTESWTFCFGECIVSLEYWLSWDNLQAFFLFCGEKGLSFGVGLLFPYTGVLIFFF